MRPNERQLPNFELLITGATTTQSGDKSSWRRPEIGDDDVQLKNWHPGVRAMRVSVAACLDHLFQSFYIFKEKSNLGIVESFHLFHLQLTSDRLKLIIEAQLWLGMRAGGLAMRGCVMLCVVVASPDYYVLPDMHFWYEITLHIHVLT